MLPVGGYKISVSGDSFHGRVQELALYFDSHSTVISGIHHLATTACVTEGRWVVLQPM